MSLINPAYAGAEGRHVISLNSRNQWSNAEDSPKTTALSYSVAGGKNVGLGISIVSDQIFIEKQTAEGLSVGVAIIPMSAEIGSNSVSRTDKLTSGTTTGTNKASADFSMHTTFYALVPL